MEWFLALILFRNLFNQADIRTSNHESVGKLTIIWQDGFLGDKLFKCVILEINGVMRVEFYKICALS